MVQEPMSLLRALNAQDNTLDPILRRAGVTDPQLLVWYDNFVDLNVFAQTVEYAFQQEYEFDPNSGLFLRHPFTTQQTAKIEMTIVDVLLLRPTTTHYHKDVDEMIRLRGGEGWFYLLKKGETRADIDKFKDNRGLHVPKGAVHGFAPEPGHYLELEVICSGILNPKKEITKKPFYDTHWQGKFERYRDTRLHP